MIWLDLGNAYGSVPHALIKYSLEFFHVPERLKLYLMQYYDGFRMRFTTRSYTTRWQELEVGIPMGCTISPILFAMAMEVIVRSARAQGRGVELAPNQVLPPICAFMDDLTLLNPSTNEADKVLVKLEELMQWARMKFKPRKSRSLVLKRGKLDSSYHFYLSEEPIPTVSEQPVKSLGRWYTEDMKDTK